MACKNFNQVLLFHDFQHKLTQHSSLFSWHSRAKLWWTHWGQLYVWNYNYKENTLVLHLIQNKGKLEFLKIHIYSPCDHSKKGIHACTCTTLDLPTSGEEYPPLSKENIIMRIKTRTGTASLTYQWIHVQVLLFLVLHIPWKKKKKDMWIKFYNKNCGHNYIYSNMYNSSMFKLALNCFCYSNLSHRQHTVTTP